MEAGQEPKVPAWPACGLWHYLTRFRYAQSLRPNRSQEEDTTEGESRVKPDHSVGSSWEFPKGHSGYAEVMTVRQDSSAIAMVLRHFDGRLSRAWEERDAPMVFTASSCERDSVVFDGQGHHVGEHLTYRRSGKNLLIVGDFLHHGTPDHEEWHMIRAGD